MKKLGLLIISLAFVLSASPAFAIPVDINVNFLYDWGRLYNYTPGTPGVYDPLTVNPGVNGVADYNTYNPSIPGYTITENTTGNADGKEDTWGIGLIDNILYAGGSSGAFYDSDTAANELTFMFYGFDDNYISNPIGSGGTDALIESVGGHLLVYSDFGANTWDPSQGTAGRTGNAAYNSVTEGTLVLDLMPVVNPISGATLASTANFSNGSGAGNLLLEVSGAGAWDSLFDTNTQDFGADFLFTFTSRANLPPDANTVGDWIIRGDAGGESDVIPEPASMILFSIGLLGGAVRRFFV